MIWLRTLILAVGLLAGRAAFAIEPADYRSDAVSLERLIQDIYAYPERLPGGKYVLTAPLVAEANAVDSKQSLLRFLERALLLLADHHAITGNSFADSWAVVPSFSDLWVDRQGGAYRLTVRAASPAEAAGIHTGDRLVSVGGVEIDEAVTRFWADLGVTTVSDVQAGFAARVIAAGRRNSTRDLVVAASDGAVPRALTVPNLYSRPRPDAPVTSQRRDGALHIVLHDSLGDSATIAAFDEAMRGARPGERVVIDLRETPSGGNTVVARAMMGWFVDRPRSYQVHRLPREERETGIARQWIEQVLPRGDGKFHRGPVTVLVSRWTGSMGEGLGIGFKALGARVVGTPMAGLLGAIEDYRLERSGLVVKLPTERLSAVDGTPREAFVPRPR